jgi:CHAD domain-containing protein
VKKLEAYGRKRFSHLIHGIKAFRKKSDSDILHRIRVEIKKTKALLNLMDATLPRFRGHKRFIPFRRIFRMADDIRRPAVTHTLLKGTGVHNAAADLPGDKKLTKSIKRFQRNIPDFLRSVKAERKDLGKFYSEVSKRNIRKYLKTNHRAVKNLLWPSFDAAELHDVRKLIKEIIYLQPLYQRVALGPFYRVAEEIIGLWHDKQTALEDAKKKLTPSRVKRLESAAAKDLKDLAAAITRYYK